MARPPLRRQLEELAGKFEPVIQQAFLDAISDLRSNAQIARIVERLERNDIDGALRALNVEPAAFRAFEEAIRQAYNAGGTAAAGSFPAVRGPDGSAIIWRFDARHPTAERFMQELSGTRITQITDDVLLGARNHLTQGMFDGRNPRSVALDLVGRRSRATGRRTGGVLGLTSRQEEYVAAARRELLSGDPAQLARFMKRGRVDGNARRTIAKAIREGKTPDAETVARLTGRYSDSLLLLRGETVARTEAIGALNSSAKSAADQMIDNTGINRQDVRKVWRATKDASTRDSHRNIDSESVGIDERFSNGLMFPCEPGGAASEVINCRCVCDYRVDHLANLR